MKKLILLLLLTIWAASEFISAETSFPDSLQMQLKSASQDTIRWNLMYSWCLAVSQNQPKELAHASELYINELQKAGEVQRLVQFYIRLGEIYEQYGDYFQAIDQYYEAAVQAAAAGDKANESLAYNKTGNVFISLGDFSKALENHLKSLTLKEITNDKAGIAISYTNLGVIYNRVDSVERARDYYLKGLAIEKENKNERGIANLLNNLGTVYEKELKYDTALFYYEQSIQINEKFNNQYDIATTFINMANIYNSTDMPAKAMEYYNKALKIYEDIKAKKGMAETYLSIGVFYNFMLEYRKAIDNLLKAHEIGKELKSLEILVRSSKELSESYGQLRDFEKALNFYKLYKRAEDQLSNEESSKNFTRLEMQHTFDKKQREQEYQRQQERRQQLFRTAVILMVLVFVTILAIVIYRNYRIQRRDKELLAQQKEEIEAQRDLVMHQRDQIQHQKEEITASIHYASRIQNAILPPEEFRKDIMKEHFVLYKPRDIVSGDYYWMTNRNNKTVVVGADCTGHGVPGAFMSMLGVSFLHEIVNKEEILHADQILNRLRDQVIRSLHQTGKEGENKDGMDISLMVIDEKSLELEFAGAFNPCYVIREGVITELKADRMPIGIFKEKEGVMFSSQKFQLQKGDTVYCSSDGYEDQFGGPDGKKLKVKTFKDLLVKIYSLPMEEQRNYLDHYFEEWRSGYEQVDDVLVIGMRI